MNLFIFSRSGARKALVVLMIAQLGALGALAQSSRARERANDNARFNRDRNAEQGRNTEQGRNADRRSMSDNDFILEAYQRNLAEIKMAHLAVDNSRDPDIQKIGHRVINEQQRANDDLKRLAAARNITMPTDVTQADQATADRLAKLQAADFDRAYRDHLNTEYKQTVRLFEREAQNAQDKQVRDVASEYANLFEQHAQTIGITGLGAASSTAGASTAPAANDRGYVRERETRDTRTLTGSENKLLGAIYRNSRLEVEMSRIAMKNSKDAQVQKLAQTILADHRQMNQDLTDLASRRGVTLPRDIVAQQQEEVTKLEKLSGNEFDREYHENVLLAHRNALQALKSAEASSDPDVRNFGSKYASTVQEHMRSIQRTGEGGSK